MLDIKETDTNTLKSYFESNQKEKVIPVTNVNFGNLKSREEFSPINNNNGSSSLSGTKRNMEEKSENPILKKIKSVVAQSIDNNPVYEGELSPDGKYHGQGTLVKGNSIYKGEWENGELPYGIREGLNKNNKLVKYEGQFNDNLNPHGFGNLSNDYGKYEGEFKNGVYHGEGTCVIREYTYKGTWENGVLKEGIKKKDIKDRGNITYKGRFVNMQLDGYGEKINLNNGKYTGKFSNGLEEGEGIFEFENLYYEGIWEKGRLMKGKRVDKTTKIEYEGNFDKDLTPQGLGELRLPNGVKLAGNFQDGKPHTSIIYTHSDVTKNEAEYVNGNVFSTANEECEVQIELEEKSDKESNNDKKKQTLFFQEGKYYGYVKNTLPHGEGILNIGTKMYEGEWNDGKLSSGTVIEDGEEGDLYTYIGDLYNLQFHGQGTLSFKEFKYEGSFKNGLIDGKGVWTTMNRKFHVEFINNTLQKVIRTTDLAGKLCKKPLELDEEILLFLSDGFR